ncbi:transcription factor CRF1-domain-containing protein [Zygosaccharomyces rouxii]|nr:transcription factor CRF1-domain-containing protein [Zygosaccharomyces rouxii]
MKALSALKRDGSNLGEERDSKRLATESRQPDRKTELEPISPILENEQAVSSTDGSDMDEENVNTEALSFKFRKDDDGIRFGKVDDEDSEEDIGEEVQDADDTSNNNSLEIQPDDNLNQLHVPHFSDSEDSEYNIDQDAYFNAIEDEDDLVGIENGLDPNEDEDGDVLREEENMISALQNDDDISFDGSIRESGSDPETMSVSAAEQNRSVDGDDESDDEDDEMMTVFDMPFFEDPKFASLYYCEDGSEPRLSLSTSLPLLTSDEKMLRKNRREAKKLERKERIQRRKQLKEKRSRVKKSGVKKAKSDYNDEEFMFGVFFNNDQDDSESGFNGGSLELKKKLDFDSPLRRLGSAAASDISSDDEYDNILMDIANIPSSDDSDDEKITKDKKGHENGEEKIDESVESTSDGLELELGETDDELQDDSSVSNVFIDIDDLDPDSFYFHYSEDDASTSYSEMMTDDTDADKKEKEEDSKEDAVETVTYANDESTDEDDNLPPPSSRSKNIGTKAKEVVSANVVGLKPPKLGTWETDSKPFTIIDGLSTKSLYPLIQEHQHLLEQQQRAQSQSPEYHSPHEVTSANGDELTLNELLNMSELEDEEAPAPSYSQAASDWYQRPAVPLSAFRNKGVNSHEDDEVMLPANSTRKVPIGYIGSERTRRKIDKVKELQRKKNEKKRKLKKRKRLLKLKRDRQRAEKENGVQSHEAIGVDEGEASLQLPDSDFIMDRAIEDAQQETEGQRSRKNSVKSVGLAEIHEILGNDNSDLLENNVEFFDAQAEEDAAAMEVTDADILASLTAPVDLNDVGRRPFWRRRQSMVEAAAENLRFTKNGLFSESALADIEGFFNNSGVTSNAFEFNESLQ